MLPLLALVRPTKVALASFVAATLLFSALSHSVLPFVPCTSRTVPTSSASVAPSFRSQMSPCTPLVFSVWPASLLTLAISIRLLFVPMLSPASSNT